MIKTLFHAMEEKTLEQFIETKRDLLAIAQTMTAEARNAARVEIMEAATIYDLPDGEFKATDLYKVDDEGVAYIPVIGKLTEAADVCDGFFSSVTTYPFITTAAMAADNDPNVNKIVFNFATGGGGVNGVDRTARVLANLQKDNEARVHGMCASAGYWLASQLNRIVAMSPTDFIGSVGVCCELVDSQKADEGRGIKRYVITSTDAPDKRPDISTEDGRKKYVEELDALHEVFVQRISEGRKVSKSKVNSDFGKGGILIASKALAAGMIDFVEGTASIQCASVEIVTPPAAAGIPKKEDQQMKNLVTLLAENPTAQAEHNAALAAARTEGEQAIKDRVTAAAAFLGSDKYPKTVSETAVKVITGEVPVASLTTVVAAVDAVREEQAAQKAADATGKAPETPGQQAQVVDPAKLAGTDEEIDAAITAVKAEV